VVGGVEFREVVVTGRAGVEGFDDVFVRSGVRDVPLPPPEAPVGTNSRANGFGWKPGLSLREFAGEAVRDSG
jgi:hypothetical protein